MIKRTLLVAFAIGLATFGIAKPGRTKTHSKSSKSHHAQTSSKKGSSTKSKSSKARTSKTAPKSAKATKAKTTGYTVRSGDNDWTIAKRAGISVTQLRHMNGGKSLDKIKAGEKINVPKPKAVAKSKSSTSHTVAKVSHHSRTTSVKSSSASKAKVAAAAEAKRNAALVARRRAAALAAQKRASVAATKVAVVTRSAPAPSTSGQGKGNVDDIISKANTFRGVRYRYGAASRSATDCSGFTSQVFKANGYRLPRTAAEQSRMGSYVSRGSLQKGDLVFFHTVRGRRIGHVGIYVGGNKFIHASSGGGRVMVSSLGEGYYNARYVTARRIAKGVKISAVVKTAEIAEETQQVPVDPEPQQGASDVVGN